MNIFITLITAYYMFVGCPALPSQTISVQQMTPQKISYLKLGKAENRIITVEEDVDLKGCICELPKNSTLIMKGGIIRNGTLKGYQTKLICKRKAFDHVTITGKWVVPEIKTSYFCNLNYDNALKDVMALTNPDVKNTVRVEKGEYLVAALRNNKNCIEVNSNTTLIIDGTIKLRPNDFSGYNIICAKGRDIKIEGKGTIVGDKHTHLGEKGEWGMGINLYGVQNAAVTGLKVKECWGDCIYVGGHSRNVTIDHCQLDHGRRQGISVTRADFITIRNSKITNVEGTKPQYAIDLEPNKGDTVDHVLIEKIIVQNCKGGLLSTTGKKNDGRFIGEVVIKNCQLFVYKKYPIILKKCQSALVENCTIYTSRKYSAIYTVRCDRVTIKNNTIYRKNEEPSIPQYVSRVLKGEVQYEAIRIEDSESQDVYGNRITE